jgi:hypothetical protein
MQLLTFLFIFLLIPGLLQAGEFINDYRRLRSIHAIEFYDLISWKNQILSDFLFSKPQSPPSESIETQFVSGFRKTKNSANSTKSIPFPKIGFGRSIFSEGVSSKIFNDNSSRETKSDRQTSAWEVNSSTSPTGFPQKLKSRFQENDSSGSSGWSVHSGFERIQTESGFSPLFYRSFWEQEENRIRAESTQIRSLGFERVRENSLLPFTGPISQITQTLGIQNFEIRMKVWEKRLGKD